MKKKLSVIFEMDFIYQKLLATGIFFPKTAIEIAKQIFEAANTIERTPKQKELIEYFYQLIVGDSPLQPLPKTNLNIAPEVCYSCRWFHGHSYSGNVLVCGIHPYGQEHCSDLITKERI